MSYTAAYTGSFKKDFKRAVKRGYNMELLKIVVDLLLDKGDLPREYYPHALRDNYSCCRECHINPDWLLIWEINKTENTIIFHRTGTHSDLFR